MANTRGGTFTVAANQTASTTNDLQITDGSMEIVGFIVVGNIVSTAMTIKTSDDGILFQTINTPTGSAISITVASNTNIGLTQDIRAELGRWRYLQLIMGSSETGGATIRTLIK